MKVARIEPRHTFSIYLPTSLYQKLVDKAGKGKISTFIKVILEEKLVKEEQDQKEKLKEKLITAHKRMAKNKKLQKELKTMERAQFEDWKDE